MARGAGPGASWPARFPFSSRTFSFLLHSFLPPSLGRPGRSSTVGSGGGPWGSPSVCQFEEAEPGFGATSGWDRTLGQGTRGRSLQTAARMT